MPFCVNCREEYPPGIDCCPECGGEVVKTLPSEPIPTPTDSRAEPAMYFCRRCGYEYLPGIKQCPECGADLVPVPPEPIKERTPAKAAPKPVKEPFVRIWDSPDELTAISVKGALAQARIPVLEQVQRSWAYDGIDLSMRGVYSVFLAPESRAKEARQLIEKYLRGSPSERAAPDEDASEDEDLDD